MDCRKCANYLPVNSAEELFQNIRAVSGTHPLGSLSVKVKSYADGNKSLVLFNNSNEFTIFQWQLGE